MFKFLSRMRKGSVGGANPLDESASMGVDPYLAEITTVLGRSEAIVDSDGRSTIQDEGQRTQRTDIS